jgi:hypothetical protein
MTTGTTTRGDFNSERDILVGGPPPGMFQPLSGTVTITHTPPVDEPSGTDPITVEVGEDGMFSTQLPPGRYSLVGISPSVGGVVCSGGPVEVGASTSTVADVQCPLP